MTTTFYNTGKIGFESLFLVYFLTENPSKTEKDMKRMSAFDKRQSLFQTFSLTLRFWTTVQDSFQLILLHLHKLMYINTYVYNQQQNSAKNQKHLWQQNKIWLHKKNRLKLQELKNKNKNRNKMNAKKISKKLLNENVNKN